MYGLLKGFRIVEASSFVAAPLCALTLAQLGADVIRIDPIGGGPDFRRWPLAASGLSFYWEGLNKAKRSIAIDVTRPEGRELIASLITRPGPECGYFVTNYPAKGFLSHEALSARRNDLITIRITGSSDGRNAVDYTVNCATGYPKMTGPVGADAPVNHVLPAWDIATGLNASVALLAAAHRRNLTGEGREFLVSLSNTAFSTLSMLGHLAEVAISGHDRPRYGNAIFGSFGRDFTTADNRRIMITAVTPRQWRGLVSALGLEVDIAALEARLGVRFESDESARFSHREALFGLIQRETGARHLENLAEVLDYNSVCWGEYNTVREALDRDIRLSATNPLFERISHPSGETYIAAGFPGIVPGADREAVRPAPQLGGNTDEILAQELGLSERAIARLHDEALVAGPEAMHPHG